MRLDQIRDWFSNSRYGGPCDNAIYQMHDLLFNAYKWGLDMDFSTKQAVIDALVSGVYEIRYFHGGYGAGAVGVAGCMGYIPQSLIEEMAAEGILESRLNGMRLDYFLSQSYKPEPKKADKPDKEPKTAKT